MVSQACRNFKAGGVDKARFYDSAGNDSFSGYGNEAIFNCPEVDFRATGFDWVSVSATSGGNNTRQTDAVDFVLLYTGTWTDA